MPVSRLVPRIEPLQRCHIALFAAAEARTSLTPWRIDHLSAAVDSDVNCWQLMVGDSPAGYLVYRNLPDGAELLNIFILQQFRRRQYGRFLMDSLTSAVRQQHGRFIWLEVHADNQAAIDFYKLSGFVQQSVRKDYYQIATNGAPRGDAILMQLLLSNDKA